MTPDDLRVRRATYRLFVELGRAPVPAEVAADCGLSTADALDSWRRLHDEHALVLDPTGDRIWMANPFSAVETMFRVHAGGRSWWANCAWDAFGICAALRSDGRIETACPDCGDPIVVHVRDGQPDVTDLVFHCLVSARSWWLNIGFT